MKEPITAVSASLALLTAALWGGIVVAVKYSEDTLPPIAVAAVRFAIAGVFMFFWCLFSRRSLRLSGLEFRLTATVALLLLAQILTFNYAVHWSNSSHGTLLISSFVFWVALIEHFVTGSDRLTRRKAIGIALAAAGVVVTLLKLPAQTGEASTHADLPSAAGDALMIISAMLLAVKIVYTKYAVGRMEPSKLIFWHHILGMTLFLIFSLAVEDIESISLENLTMPVILALLYQGVLVGGVCFAIQAVLLKRHTATAISVFSFATPIFGVAAALAVRGDPYTGWLLVAGLIVAAGIYLANSEG